MAPKPSLHELLSNFQFDSPELFSGYSTISSCADRTCFDKDEVNEQTISQLIEIMACLEGW